jgi:flagellar biosynthetic protein FliQ
MSIGDVTTLLRGGVFEICVTAAPMLIAALVVGMVIAIFQATTSMQEQTMTFVPKLIAILAVLALLGGWMFNQVADYTTNLFNMIPDMAG